MTAASSRRIMALVRLAAVLAVATFAAACTSAATPAPVAPPVAATFAPPVAQPVAVPVPKSVDGTAYYYKTAGSVTQLFAMTGHTATSIFKIPTPPADSCVRNSVSVSPDGQHLAWITGAAPYGTLTVSRLDGTSPHTYPNVACAIANNDWDRSGATLRVVVRRGNQPRDASVDLKTGELTLVRAADGVVWSRSQYYQVREIAGTTSFIISNANGAGVTTVPNYTNTSGTVARCGFTLDGLSDSGRFVAIGGCTTGSGRVLGANYLFDTAVGLNEKLPLDNVDYIGFLPGDLVIIHGGRGDTRSFVLMSMLADPTASLAEPTALAGATLLRYLPAYQQ